MKVKDKIVEILKEELAWSKNNTDDFTCKQISSKYREGYIAGLEQAIWLVQTGLKK